MLTLYKKTYPHLIDKILKKKNVTIHGYCTYPWSLCS